MTWESGEPASVTEGVFDAEAGELRGMRIDGVQLQASDPRLSGVAYFVINGNAENGTETGAVVESRSYGIVNDEGAWTETATFVDVADITGEDPVPIRATTSRLSIRQIIGRPGFRIYSA